MTEWSASALTCERVRTKAAPTRQILSPLLASVAILQPSHLILTYASGDIREHWPKAARGIHRHCTPPEATSLPVLARNSRYLPGMSKGFGDAVVGLMFGGHRCDPSDVAMDAARPRDVAATATERFSEGAEVSLGEGFPPRRESGPRWDRARRRRAARLRACASPSRLTDARA